MSRKRRSCCCGDTSSGGSGGSDPCNDVGCECFDPCVEGGVPDTLTIETTNSSNSTKYYNQVYTVNYDPEGHDAANVPADHPIRNYDGLCQCITANNRCTFFYWAQIAGTSGACDESQIAVLWCRICCGAGGCTNREITAAIYAGVPNSWPRAVLGQWRTAPLEPVGLFTVDGELFCTPTISTEIVTVEPEYDMELCAPASESDPTIDIQVYE